MGFSRQETAVVCHGFLKGILRTQRLEQGLLRCRWILYHLSYKGGPYLNILGLNCDLAESSSLTENQTRPPALGVRSLSHWTTKEVPKQFFKIYPPSSVDTRLVSNPSDGIPDCLLPTVNSAAVNICMLIHVLSWTCV